MLTPSLRQAIFARPGMVFVGFVAFVMLSGWSIVVMSDRLMVPAWLIGSLIALGLLVPVLVFLGDAFIITTLFIALAYPYRIRLSFGPLNSFSIVEVVLLLGWSILLLRYVWRARAVALRPGSLHGKFQLNFLDLAIGSYVAINLISFFWSERQDWAIRGLIPIVENLACYYLILFYSSTRARLNHLLALFLLLGSVAFTLAAAFYFWRLDFLNILPPQDETAWVAIRTRLGSPAWGQSNYFASAMLLFVPSYFSLAILARSWSRRLLFGVVSAGALVTFFFSLSRGGFIALAGGLISWLVVILTRRQLRLSTVISMTVAAAAVSLGLNLTFSHFPDVHLALAQLPVRVFILDDVNTEARMSLVPVAWNLIQTNFWGVGVGNSLTIGQFGGLSVHDIYLQTIVEIGWLGFMLFALMLILLLRENWQLLAALEGTAYKPLAYGLLVSFVAVLINVAGEASFEGVVFGWIFWTAQSLVRALVRLNVRDASSRLGNI